MWDPEYEEGDEESSATPIFCLACGVNVGYGKKSMAQHIHGVNKKGVPTRHELKVQRMDKETLENPPPLKPRSGKGSSDMQRLAKKKYGKDTERDLGSGKPLLTSGLGRKSFLQLLREPYTWEHKAYPNLLSETYELHPNGRVLCRACNAFIEYGKRAMCQHVHGRGKPDGKPTKHQQHVSRFREQIKEEGSNEEDLAFDTMTDLQPHPSIYPLRKSTGDATIMERVRMLEETWLGEVQSEGAMKDRLVSIEEFIFGLEREGSFMERLVALEDELTMKGDHIDM